MDLKEWSHQPTIWFLHMIDHFSRYSVSCVIHSKRKEVIVDKILKHCIATFGHPHKFLTDNGGEFCNDEFISLCENFNIRVCTTAAESPWSNGLVERHNGILGLMVPKVIENSNCSLETSLAWSVSAKNSLANVHGYSSNQLVFGKNPNYPNVLEDKLPALEASTCSEIVAKNLNALHFARQQFIQKESSDRLRRALHHNVRTYSDITYSTSDLVYYRREKDSKWSGPGTVIGKEGQQILVKHSSSYIRVHPCRLQPLLHQSPSNQGGSVLPDTTAQSPSDTCDKVPPEKPINSAMNLEPDSDDETNNEESEPFTTDTENLATTSSNSQVKKPRIKQHVKIRESDDTEWEPVKIINRGGKATGKYSNWYNVQNLDNSSLKCVNWDTLKEWKPMPDTNEILFSKNEQYDQSELLQAKLYELDKWKENNVYTEVKYENQSYISLRWVNTCKYVDGCKKIKARLVARGFEEANSTVFTDSLKCSKESLRLIFTICASKSWKIHSIDISTAFLQGKSIDREVYVLPPAEANVFCFVL